MKTATSHLFKQRVPDALADANLKAAMDNARDGFVGKRRQSGVQRVKEKYSVCGNTGWGNRR